MDQNIPSAEQVRQALRPLNLRQVDVLARLSGVPATTIYKIKRGETKNPGIETLRDFFPHISAALAAPELPTGPGATMADQAKAA